MFLLISGCPKFETFRGKSIANVNMLVPGGNDFDKNQTTLYICTVLYKGNFVPGKYHNERQSCRLIWEGTEHSRTSNFQILKLSSLQINNGTLK